MEAASSSFESRWGSRPAFPCWWWRSSAMKHMWCKRWKLARVGTCWKRPPPQEFERAIYQVDAGEAPMSAAIARHLLKRLGLASSLSSAIAGPRSERWPVRAGFHQCVHTWTGEFSGYYLVR